MSKGGRKSLAEEVDAGSEITSYEKHKVGAGYTVIETTRPGDAESPLIASFLSLGSPPGPGWRDKDVHEC
jgi:hypothetical protein